MKTLVLVQVGSSQAITWTCDTDLMAPANRLPSFPSPLLFFFRMASSGWYLDLWSGHQQRDVLVPLAGQQSNSVLPVLDLHAVDLDRQTDRQTDLFKGTAGKLTPF